MPNDPALKAATTIMGDLISHKLMLSDRVTWRKNMTQIITRDYAPTVAALEVAATLLEQTIPYVEHSVSTCTSPRNCVNCPKGRKLIKSLRAALARIEKVMEGENNGISG